MDGSINQFPEQAARDNIEKSFKENKPRALVQMASGAGKTYTAITSNYRLLKFANAKRILFLVDTIHLGEQAEQEFMAYQPSDDNRKFTELYNVQRLQSNYISPDSQVCICTIQRLYSILKGEELDEDVSYSKKELDKDVVNPSQIRNITRVFKNKLPEIFPGRKEVPKTLIFAKTDSHADDIIQIVREEFNEGNEFCNKITYKTEEDPKSVLARFRNSYYPRIAVTVAMISVGIDVKPLECLLFLRDVKSKSYFEQMKGRGTRTFGYDDLKKVTPSVLCAKTHFVVVDAVTMGVRDEDLFISLAGRLARLQNQLTDQEKETFEEKAKGKTLSETVKDLLNAYNPDKIEEKAQVLKRENPEITETQALKIAKENLSTTASSIFNGELNGYIEDVHKVHEQIIDIVNIDNVTKAEWENDSADKAREIVNDFSTYIKEHKDEIVALSIFYNQPYKLRELTSSMVKDVLEKLKMDKPMLAPLHVWHAYEQLEDVNGKSPKDELIALVSLIRRVTGMDNKLTAYERTYCHKFSY